MLRLAEELYPICRSITGDGLRQTLDIIGREIPLRRHEVPSGTRAFDWVVPDEWNLNRAYIETPEGERIVDTAAHNLHVVNYSTPIDAVLSREELRPHLHTLPDRPDWIPYKTSYYERSWGFCLSERQRAAMTAPRYRVVIDAKLRPGALSYGELVLEGRRADEEVLVSTHCCHPSLANDNLSGIVVATTLAKALAGKDRERTWRFLFLPGTIGAVVWLARNEATAARIRYGMVLAGVGSRHDFIWKRSRRGNAAIDRILAHALTHSGESFSLRDFSPYGYDERQYCSPGFNLPVGCLMRGLWGEYPEYHTSADNLGFLSAEKLAGTLALLRSVAEAIEHGDETWRNLSPKGEPQLGARGLYRDTPEYDRMTLLWVLNLADGKHTLLDIAERAGQPLARVRAAAQASASAGLLERLSPPRHSC
jgi:aminopeptidase-like protein